MSKSTSQRSAAAIVNNSAQPTSPRSPLHGSASVFDRRGARAKSSKLAPLLVLAGFRTHKQLTKNKSQQLTPFWHNDTRPRVTVTFGARRLVKPLSRSVQLQVWSASDQTALAM